MKLWDLTRVLTAVSDNYFNNLIKLQFLSVELKTTDAL